MEGDEELLGLQRRRSLLLFQITRYDDIFSFFCHETKERKKKKKTESHPRLLTQDNSTLLLQYCLGNKMENPSSKPETPFPLTLTQCDEFEKKRNGDARKRQISCLIS